MYILQARPETVKSQATSSKQQRFKIKGSSDVLAEGREHGLMKQFLQPFAPGADRFEGLALEASPGEQPLLPDALALMGSLDLVTPEIDR